MLMLNGGRVRGEEGCGGMGGCALLHLAVKSARLSLLKTFVERVGNEWVSGRWDSSLQHYINEMACWCTLNNVPLKIHGRNLN